MSTLTFKGDGVSASCDGPPTHVAVPFDEGGTFYLYVKDGGLVVGDSPPVAPAPKPEPEAKPRAKKNAKAKKE